MFRNKNSISKEISQMIINTGNIQDLMRTVQEGNFNREEIIAQCNEALRGTSQFAGMKLQIDEKENITAKTIKAKDLDQYEQAIYNIATKSVSGQQQDLTDGR